MSTMPTMNESLNDELLKKLSDDLIEVLTEELVEIEDKIKSIEKSN